MNAGAAHGWLNTSYLSFCQHPSTTLHPTHTTVQTHAHTPNQPRTLHPTLDLCITPMLQCASA